MTDLAERPTAADRHLPGDINMWIFVLGDLVFFAAYFVIFMLYRVHDRHLFLAAQHHLSLTIGALNTLALLASSRFVALGVRSTRGGDTDQAVRQVACGAACGVVFIGLKAYEWSVEIGHGHTLPSNNFFMFYFALTGLHLLHVIFGLGALGIGISHIRRARTTAATVMETCATYWHMVDLLWVVIFVLLYVMR